MCKSRQVAEACVGAQMNALRVWSNPELGALQYIFKVQIPDRVSETRDAQHAHLPCLHHSMAELMINHA